MTSYYTASAFFHPTDGSYSAFTAATAAGRVFVERLDKDGIFVDPPVTEWNWRRPGPAPDWPAVAMMVRLFSVRMADIVQAHLGELDAVQWIPAVVTSTDGHRGDYRIAHFTERPDVLDPDASTFGPNGQPIRWVLSARKITGRHFFPSHDYGRNVIISATLRTALLDAKLTGLDIDPVRLVD
ncbi:DUF1629 domain-containing protein [Sanguibacter sp. 25GB23B1]|uniref:imm11 family protein n=1 Tax=unclassified Sanguibacter TaxID=2645534 RepID=UPI0032AF37EB